MTDILSPSIAASPNDEIGKPQLVAEFRFLSASLSHPTQLAENLVDTGSARNNHFVDSLLSFL